MMIRNQILAFAAVVCLAAGCTQQRWQVFRQPAEHGYQPPSTLAEGSKTSPTENKTAGGTPDVAESHSPDASSVTDVSPDEATPVIRLASATLDTSETQAVGKPAMATDVAPLLEAPELEPAAGTMTLDDFESLAFSNNPAIRELAATTQKAAGFRHQVGLKANPTFGYQGQQLADESTDQHLAFFEQEFVTGGKLELNRVVLNETLRAQLMELEAQKLRVATDVRIKFYEALAAQQRLQLISTFQSLTDQGVEMAELRYTAAEGSRIDVLQASVQKNEIDLTLQQTQAVFDAAWRSLTALTGTPQLQPATLSGDLPETLDSYQWEAVSSMLVSRSPEYSAAQIRVSRARAALQRQGVQAVPNISLQFGAGYDNSTESGMMNVQVGAPIPVFNRNEGNIAAAQAEYCRATLEVQRIERSIESRLAEVSREYDSALAAVNMYSQEILPNAEEALKLAEMAYQAGETSFVQVLVVRRTYFESNLQYILNQAKLAQAEARIDGCVLTGGLDAVMDDSGDDSLRGLTFGQQ